MVSSSSWSSGSLSSPSLGKYWWKAASVSSDTGPAGAIGATADELEPASACFGSLVAFELDAAAAPVALDFGGMNGGGSRLRPSEAVSVPWTSFLEEDDAPALVLAGRAGEAAGEAASAFAMPERDDDRIGPVIIGGGGGELASVRVGLEDVRPLLSVGTSGRWLVGTRASGESSPARRPLAPPDVDPSLSWLLFPSHQ
jgi:hypothetical protein